MFNLLALTSAMFPVNHTDPAHKAKNLHLFYWQIYTAKTDYLPDHV